MTIYTPKDTLLLQEIADAQTDGSQKMQIVGAGGTVVDVNDEGQLHVVMEGKADDNNSTEIPLGIDEVFTGEATNILEFGAIAILVNPDQDSATDGLMVQFSADGTSWHPGESYTILANATKFFTPPCQSTYYRVVYTNGGIAQTIFSLTTTLKKQPIKWSSHRVQDNLNDEDDGTLNLSVLKLRTALNNYVSGSATNSGNFKISIEEFDTAVSQIMADFTDNMDGEVGMMVAAAMYGRVDSDTLVPIKLDGSTQDTQIIEHEHAEIHSGDHYSYCDYTLNVSSATEIDFVFVTPNTAKWIHLVFEIYASEGATIELYKDSTGISGGTSITPLNNNGNTLNTSDATVTKDPTITGDGTRAAGFLAGGTRTAGATERSKEYVLEQDTTYLLRLTSLANSNNISWCAEWYEHTNKN